MKSGGSELDASASGTLTVDLGALQTNWRSLRDSVGDAECAAAVKADAYGIGLEPAVGALWSAGCGTFFVAYPGEAAQVRACLPDAVVYVLNGLAPGGAPRLLDVSARPVLGSLDEVREWASICETQGRSFPAALHVDTGMNRLGLSMDKLPALPGALGPVFRPSLVMSHFACADDPEAPLNRRQLASFALARSALPGTPASLANSPGIFLPEQPYYDLVRPGYALYGGNPTPCRPNPMRPVVGLDARIIQVREVAAGDSVGYGAAWTARTACRIATVSVGYADGFLRAGGATDDHGERDRARGAALVAGRLCFLVGRVSMDLVTLDVSDVPPKEVQRGDPVTLIGGALDIDEVARRAGTIGYEMLTSLGRRYSRRYLT